LKCSISSSVRSYISNKAEEILQSDIIRRLGDKNWKERLPAIEELSKLLSEKTLEYHASGLDGEVLVRLLEHAPSFKDSNFQVGVVNIEAKRCETQTFVSGYV